jgi:hypothetical protein
MDTSQDMQNMGAEEHHMNPNRVIVSILLVLIIVIAGYFIFWGGEKPAFSGKSEVTYTELNDPAVSKIPVGFPTTVPVEEQNIKESYKVNYLDAGMMQYVVGFNTEMSKEDIWKLYTDTFTAVGYATNDENMNEGKGTLTGYRDGNKLNIAISSYDSGSYVTINFIQRQVSR